MENACLMVLVHAKQDFKAKIVVFHSAQIIVMRTVLVTKEYVSVLVVGQE
jgi:hypothetical protein